MEIELVRRRVQTRLERKRMGPEAWLVVTRRPLTDDRPLEPRASRDATDQDTRYRYHYSLTPTCVSEIELAEPSLSELARVITAGAGMEIYQSCNLHKTLFWQKIDPCVAKRHNKSRVSRYRVGSYPCKAVTHPLIPLSPHRSARAKDCKNT